MSPPAEPAFVIDCSVIMAWCFEDEQDAYAEAVLNRLQRTAAIAPALWRLEAANALLVAERRGRITRTKAEREMNVLARLPIRDEMESLVRGLSPVASLARAHRLSSYDAAYLELALRIGLPLATLDGASRTAAKSAGVKLFS